MGDLRSSCEHLYSRLNNLQGELEFMKNKGQILSTESLDQYQTVVVKFLHFLERNGGRSLVYHVAKYTAVAGELKALHEDVSELFFDLLDVTAVDQWGEDCRVLETVLASAISDNSVALRDLQSPRAQLEAILTLKFELEKQQERHNQAGMARMRSLMETIKTASRVSVEQLPAWFLPDYEVEFESQPFAKGSCGSVHRGVWNSDTPVVVKCFAVDDMRIDNRTARQLEKELDRLFQMDNTNIVSIFGASHVNSPPFLVSEDTNNGDMGSYLSLSDDNKTQMWKLLYQAALGLAYIHTMCMIEATAGEPPFAYLDADDVRENLKSGIIPEKPDEMSGKVWELVVSMTNIDPSKRVELTYVIDKLKVFTTEDLDEQRQDEATRCITWAALVFDLSRCCAQCGNQVGLKEESPSSCGSPGSPNTLVELNTDTSVVDLIDVLRSGPIDEQESAVLLLLQASIRDHKRQQMQQENGVPILVDLVKKGRTHFLKVCALGWSTEVDSTPPDDEFEALQSAVRAATDAKCTSVVHALQVNTAKDKLKTVVYCACAAEANGREPLLNVGAISRLVKLLGNGSEALAIWTMDALGNMASDDDTKNAIVAEGAIPMLVKLLQNGTETQRGFAAYVLGQLSINSASSTATIVESGAIPFLVGLLRAQTNIPKNFAAFALDGIAAVSDEYGVAIVQNGGIRRLIKLLRTGTSTLKKHAASVLARLANQDENRQEIARRGAITDFITLLRRGTEDQKESAAFALSFLATDAALCADMVKFGAIAPLVALLRDGTKGQKKHAFVHLEV
ncbi:hypothetical protein PI124_g8532 [Phytophthora idaei]|nr:hypothetical protein PI124_g8532 [Phytophthora idaei]